MKLLCRLFLILVLMSSAAFAQTEEKPKAYLFDEFGQISQKEVKQRAEKLRKKLQEPASKNGGLGAYLIFYSGDKQKSLRNMEILIRDVLFDNCRDCYGFSGPGIVFVQGGEAKEQKVQFWIVPIGADPPELISDEPPKANKIDEFGEVSDRYFNWSLDNFLEKLRKVKTATGYVLNYGSDEEVSLRINKINKHFGCRDCLTDMRIVIMNGGTRETLRTELWIVPEGAEPPTP